MQDSLLVNVLISCQVGLEPTGLGWTVSTYPSLTAGCGVG